MCIFVCVYMKYIIYITRYNLLRLYNINATCTYVFRTNHLVLDNQLYSSLRKTISPTLLIPSLSVVLCLGSTPCEFHLPSVILLCLLGSSLLSSHLDSRVGEALWIASDIPKRYSLIASSLPLLFIHMQQHTGPHMYMTHVHKHICRNKINEEVISFVVI